MEMTFTLEQLNHFGRKLGGLLRGGECLELIGDVGTGKTTLTKAIARGLAIDEDVQSPSFTISRTYPARDGLELYHYDFYRLDDPGIMRHELAESIGQAKTVTVIEWGGSVTDILPDVRVIVRLQHTDGEKRHANISIPEKFNYLTEAL